MTMAVADDLYLWCTTAGTMFALKCTEESFLEESIIFLRRTVPIESRTNIKCLPRNWIHVSTVVGLLAGCSMCNVSQLTNKFSSARTEEYGRT
jgi:hypothetical protein